MLDYTYPFLPYLIQAAYDWLVDNNLVPYIEIDTTYPQVVAPKEYIIENKIVLNIDPSAINRLTITNEKIEFAARFGNNKINTISAPLNSLTAIFNPDYGYGIKLKPLVNVAIPLTESETNTDNNLRLLDKTDTDLAKPSSAGSSTKSKPKLTLIKKIKNPT